MKRSSLPEINRGKLSQSTIVENRKQIWNNRKNNRIQSMEHEVKDDKII